MENSLCEPSRSAIQLVPLAEADVARWRHDNPDQPLWTGFTGYPGQVHHARGAFGDRVFVGVPAADRQALGDASRLLPAGDYQLGADGIAIDPTQAAISWAAGSYAFMRYKSAAIRTAPRLCWPDGVDRGEVLRKLRALGLVRDLINTPANDMGPAELADAAATVAARGGAKLEVCAGDDLLAKNYPLVHAVGRASVRAPRLIDMRWGDTGASAIRIVGKGVCFDSGGLNLKSAEPMLLMKKDMAGAAHALGLAQMIMDAQLPVDLRVVIPAVENAVSGSAMRPMDVVRSRKGISVEIGNTDAEGRLILADALAAVCEDKPDLVIDFATLTSAARIALGPEVPALFCNDERLASEFLAASDRQDDPLWRMPLWRRYAANLNGAVADLVSVTPGTMAGSIHAALFLEKFVDAPWAHLDIYGWNPKRLPGRPEGGDAQGLAAAYDVIAGRAGRGSA